MTRRAVPKTNRIMDELLPHPDADENEEKEFGRGHLGHEFFNSLENDFPQWSPLQILFLIHVSTLPD
jgi:hypothetical protein